MSREKRNPLDGLNPSQVEAVKHFKGPLLILAGAGAGKTRVITHRIAYLIEGLGVMPYEILALTFTNKAAEEMRDRAERLIGENARRVTLATFHSFCNHLLRREIRQLKDYTENFSIYDDADTRRCVKEILKEIERPMTGSHAPGRVLDAISRAKNFAADSPAELLSFHDPLAEDINDIFKRYEAKLVENNAMDFDNLLGKTLELLDSCAETRRRCRQRYQFILVDEYQDTNRVQYELLKRLCPPDGNITIVGDADQSIYGWRGADIGNMNSFERDFTNVSLVALEQNYRSKQNILDAANSLIAHNAGAREKRLWSELGAGEQVVFHLAWDDSAEAQFIVDEIDYLIGEGYRLDDVAVLFRTRAQSRPLEDAFLRGNIPYRIIGATEFYKRKEIKDAIAYLRVIDNPKDMVAFARIGNEPKRGLGPKSLARIEAAARECGSLIDIPGDAGGGKLFPPKAAPLVATIRRLHAIRRETPVPEFVRSVLEDTGYYSHVELMDKQEGVSRAENLEEFIKLSQEYARDAARPTLEGFLSKMSLVSDTDVEDFGEGRARMLTLHSAKGLEFPVVFIVGLEDGMLPHGNSLESPEGICEERRLCYVGATRAKELLYMSSCRGRVSRGVVCNNDVSRFIKEIGIDKFNILDGARGGARPGESFFDSHYDSRAGNSRGGKLPRNIHFGGGDDDDEVSREAADDIDAPRRMSKKASRETADLDEDRFDGVDDEIIREKYGFRAGDKVEHTVFGEGRIVSFKGDEICVAFTGAGIKRLSAKYAPLAKIN